MPVNRRTALKMAREKNSDKVADNTPVVVRGRVGIWTSQPSADVRPTACLTCLLCAACVGGAAWLGHSRLLGGALARPSLWRPGGPRRALRVCCFLGGGAGGRGYDHVAGHVCADRRQDRTANPHARCAVGSAGKCSPTTPCHRRELTPSCAAAACNLFAGRCRALHASRNRVRAVGLHRR